MLLSTPDGRQALQQARLQATTGHAEEAVASYNKLFNGAPPEGDIACRVLEYGGENCGSPWRSD